MKSTAEGLLTDLYQLTMLQAYFNEDMQEQAVFEFFVRDLGERNFLVAAGLAQACEYLTQLHFTKQDIQYLKKLKLFSENFLDYLSTFRFTGTVNAMPEGTIFFANEPILQIIAPLPQAQLIESRIINILHLQTLIASKAIRSTLQMPNKILIDFGMRRSHGSEAAVMAARASYLAGFTGTATVLAGKLFNIPVYGTMAHSYVQAHQYEEDAFIKFAEQFPENSILLIDTYDVLRAAHKVVELVKQKKLTIRGVRIDSGDLIQLSTNIRAIFDAAGLYDIKIFVSGDLDEYKLRLLRDAPIDGFGIGTRLNTSADQPYLNCAYKLEEYAARATSKHSTGKTTWPGKKQVYRHYDATTQMQYDVIKLASEADHGQKLLQPILQNGKFIKPLLGLEQITQHLAREINMLPTKFKSLEKITPGYEVKVSAELLRLNDQLKMEKK